MLDERRSRADAAVVTISVLGPLRIDGDVSSLGPRDRVVLEVLVLRPGEVVSAERLADAMWGDAPPATWNKVVQGCVVRLRKVLGAAAIETSPAGYRLTTPPDDVDAHRFERMVRRSSELLTLGEHDRAAYVERRGVGAVARAGAARARGLGPGPDRGRAARRAALGRRGDPPGRRPACRAPPGGAGRGAGAGRRGAAARAPVGAAGAGPVSGRPAGRRVAHVAPGPHGAGRRAGRRAGPGTGRVGAGDPAPGPVARRRCATARARRRLPVPGSGAVRRRRQPTASSGATREVEACLGRLAGGRRARGGRTLGQRQVVAGASRRGCRAATQRPSRRGDHPRCPADGRAHARCRRRSGAGPRRRPVRGGGHAVRRPGRARRVLRRPRRARRDAARWSSPCAPTVSANCPPTPASPGSSSRGCTC